MFLEVLFTYHWVQLSSNMSLWAIFRSPSMHRTVYRVVRERCVSGRRGKRGKKGEGEVGRVCVYVCTDCVHVCVLVVYVCMSVYMCMYVCMYVYECMCVYMWSSYTYGTSIIGTMYLATTITPSLAASPSLSGRSQLHAQWRGFSELFTDQSDHTEMIRSSLVPILVVVNRPHACRINPVRASRRVDVS